MGKTDLENSVGLKTEKERPLLAQEMRECKEGVCTILWADVAKDQQGRSSLAPVDKPCEAGASAFRCCRDSREELMDKLSVLTLGAGGL
jgi:hypothetical protein